MAGGTFKKLTFVALIITIISLITWLALNVAKKQQPDNAKLEKAYKAFLALWVVFLVLTLLFAGLWATRRGRAKTAAEIDPLASLTI